MQDPQKLQEENERLKAELEKVTSVQKQKDSFFKKSILNITAPQTWKGVTVGVALSILVYEIATMDAAMFAVKSILAVGVILAIGFFGGQWAVKKTQIQAQKALNNTISTSNNTAANLISKLLQITTGKKITDEHSKELSVAINQYKPLLFSGGNWVMAFLFRLMAFSSLMGVLAIAVSFAIAIATFMQVELLEKQNEKLDKQNILLEQQDSLLVQQNELLDQQNVKVGKQTDLMKRQTGQIDTQNLYIVEQIKQASIQNRLVTAQNNRLDQQTYLQEAERRSSLVFLFSNIMDAVDKELKEDYKKDSLRNLSPQLIGRIVSLSHRLSPYQYLEGDTLIKKPLSPERGQLLINILSSQLDTTTHKLIIKKCNFNHADLKSADLRNANLESADLRNANLKSADLRNVNLKSANLWHVDFRTADLSNADLEKADLWRANLTGANLKYTNLKNTDLRESHLWAVNSIGANLSNADLRNIGSFGNLRGATLTNAKTNDLLILERIEGNYYTSISIEDVVKIFNSTTLGKINYTLEELKLEELKIKQEKELIENINLQKLRQVPRDKQIGVKLNQLIRKSKKQQNELDLRKINNASYYVDKKPYFNLPKYILTRKPYYLIKKRPN